MKKSKVPPEEKGKWHTSKWYREHFGVDPLELDLPYEAVKNRYYRSGPMVKLWKEADVIPYKNKKGIDSAKRRKEAGERAFTTRRTKLIEFFKDAQGRCPRIGEITKRLWEIGNEVNAIHAEKAQCRNNDPEYDRSEYFDMGFEHCLQCSKRSERQKHLRNERATLFEELEQICGKDKKTIQLARKYLREDKGKQEDEKIGVEEIKEPQRNLEDWS